MKCAPLLLLTTLWILSSINGTVQADSPSSTKPNIILVMADDQGWGDVGYNGHPFVKTPELDAMAKEGFVFDRFYAAAPVCSPTRASVMTGRNPIRTKVTNHGRYMRPHEQTIAESLQAAGYVTGIFGKVHLGSGQPKSPCNPSGMGFDEWVVGLNFFDNDPYLSRNGKIEQRKGKGSVIAMDDALAFLNSHKDGDQPMFMVVWFPSPHDPHQEVPEGPSLYDNEKHAGYYREITLLDQQVGRLRRGLRDMEIADNTILWYCSDNGGLVEATSGGRKRKGSIYEGGLRVPGILEWPARQLKGRTNVPTWTCDIYPTLLAMAGLDTTAPHVLDGIDISNIIAGRSDNRAKPMGFWHLFQQGQATWSDRIQKAVMEKQLAGDPLPHNAARMKKDVDEFPQFPEDSTTGHAAWNDWPWKLHRINGEKYELYNLADDPMESTDLATEPEHQAKFRRMQTDLHAWMRSVIRSINGKDYSETSGNASRDAVSTTPTYEVINDYRPYIASSNNVVAWYGDRVALVLDGETNPEQRNPQTMQAILGALDNVFDAFDQVTGRRPRLTAPLNGKIRIEVSSKVGGGLAHHGRLGVGIGDGFFKGLYQRFEKGDHTVDQVFFYEIARNYWMRDMNPTIDYHTSKGPQDYGWWTVGFNNAMSIFLPAEIDSITDMYYFGSNGQRFSDGMEANLNSYLQNPEKYNWENSWNVPLIPWKERTSVNDLMTGLLIRLHRDHGGIDFIKRLYEEIPIREPLKSRADRQGARDNFYEACSLAAGKDLHDFFANELRWQISPERQIKLVSQLKPARPNVVLIFIDDMGYGDIGPFGNTTNKTPNLDRMAREGNVLRQFYVANTACTPSRAALMTGTYAARIGMDGRVNFPGETRGLNPSEVTIADMLKANGYATGCFGKWHLGDQPEFLPTQQGFDRYFGIPYSNDMWPGNKRGNPLTDRGPYTPLPIVNQNDVVAYVSDGADQSLLCEVVTDHALKFIEDQRDRPFFCYVPHAYVHLPRFARPKVAQDAGGDIDRSNVEEVDTSVGRILDKLRELKLDENTLVIFTSDNGGARGMSMGPLRGGKGGPKYEGHMREPTLTWWPGTIPAGTESQGIAVTTDLLPSLARLTGATVPGDRVIDGRDVTDILLGKPDAKSPHALHYYEVDGIRRGPWKLVMKGRNAELYNLDDDLGEQRNLAQQRPQLVQELRKLLTTHAANVAANVRPAAFVAPETAKPLISTPGDLPKLRDYMGLPNTTADGQ